MALTSNYKAFDLLAAKAKPAGLQAHRLTTQVTQDATKDGDSVITVSFRLSDLGNCKQSKGQKGAIGCMIPPIEVLDPSSGQKYRLNPGWATLSAVREK